MYVGTNIPKKLYQEKYFGGKESEPGTHIFKDWENVVQRSRDNWNGGVILENRGLWHETDTG